MANNTHNGIFRVNADGTADEYGNNKGGDGLDTAVSYDPQTLTDSEKAQARKNIDAASQSVLNVVGAKNLLPSFADDGVSISANNVTVTENADGSITISGGVCSDYTYFVIRKKEDNFKLLKGNLIVSRGSGTGATLLVDAYSGSTWVRSLAQVYTDSETLVNNNYSDYDRIGIQIRVEPNNDFTTPLTIYPMIRLAADTDDTYEPYAKTNRELTLGTSRLSNPNLLDNSWFTINQRGQSSYTGNVYTVDRWRTNGGSLTLINNGITFTANSPWIHFAQLLPLNIFEEGKEYTVSYRKTDGTYYAKTFIYHNSESWIKIWEDSISGWYCEYIKINDVVQFNLLTSKSSSENSISLRAVKLERGSVSTLANDVTPDYTIELLKCKRYFQRMQGRMYGTPRWLHFGMGAVMSATSANIALPIPTEFRAVPTISFHNGSNGFKLSQGNNVFATVTNMSIDTCTTSYVNIGVTCPSQTAVPVDSFCRLWSADADSYIDLSADL